MGRAFEYRKARKLKRWGNMARTFTRVGKEISIAVKEGGPDPDTNSRLRVIIATAKRENMPKENIERAIKKAMGKDQKQYTEMNYEGYGPHGVAIYVETATDNTTRTVANVRAIFNKFDGSLGTSGSLDFLFDHKVIFTVAKKEGLDVEELILELIDYGVEDEYEDEENEITIYAPFQSFNAIQTHLEEDGYEILSSEFTRIPTTEKEVTDEQRETLDKMIERLEEDDDVQNVYTNMKPKLEDE
ncbi:MAG: YebC/PmpR family DNA-binding transcriptional regulator [Bacteroidales bacterium]|nr:YebC/PmpR family DNA-binding transcriptional regulator [Bacteroidales bacterium]